MGSSNYITNFAGEVTQHSVPIAIGIAFGETFIEEHKNSHNSPYKYNGKELDEESGLYYYGARYYDPRISIWASVDPLANFNPFMDDEFYIDGDHNGGVFNHFNHNSYGYCYQNPVIFKDPNGKQSNVIENVFVGPNMHRNIFEIKGYVKYSNGTNETIYSFTRPASYLFSLVSETGYSNIKSTALQFRKYGNGGLTTGNESENATITYFNQKNRSTTAFFDLSAHEIGHIPQLDETGYTGVHLIRSAFGYAVSRYKKGERLA